MKLLFELYHRTTYPVYSTPESCGHAANTPTARHDPLPSHHGSPPSHFPPRGMVNQGRAGRCAPLRGQQGRPKAAQAQEALLRSQVGER